MITKTIHVLLLLSALGLHPVLAKIHTTLYSCPVLIICLYCKFFLTAAVLHFAKGLHSILLHVWWIVRNYSGMCHFNVSSALSCSCWWQAKWSCCPFSWSWPSPRCVLHSLYGVKPLCTWSISQARPHPGPQVYICLLCLLQCILFWMQCCLTNTQTIPSSSTSPVCALDTLATSLSFFFMRLASQHCRVHGPAVFILLNSSPYKQKWWSGEALGSKTQKDTLALVL